MREMFLKTILGVDNTINTVAMILSFVSGILAVVAEFSIHSKKSGWVVKLIIIVSIIVIACTFVRKNIVQVPNVVGKTYQDACNILSNNELNYNRVIDKNFYVMEQEPIAGTIVKKNSRVEVVTKPIGNDEEVKRLWEESLNVDYGNIAITFEDTNIILGDMGRTVQCFGSVLKNYTVKEAYLIEETVGVEYHDYVLEDSVMIFKNIPKGIPFELIVWLDGYEEVKKEVILSSQNTINDTYSFPYAMIRDDDEMKLSTTFYVADGDKSTMNDVKYLADVQLGVQWSEKETAWGGDYYTDQKGRFAYNIMISKDQNVRVKLWDPFGNKTDYECELTLYAPRIGEFLVQSIIFVKRDGTCNVVRTDEYFKW